MNKTLNADLLELVEMKTKLSTLTYDNKNYDEIEEQLHDLEDDFLEKYGEMLEDVISDAHEKIRSDNDTLLPIAYVGQRYTKTGDNDDGSAHYQVEHGEGVLIETELYPNKETRLVFVPSPTRIELLVGGMKKDILWEDK
ncbi:MAG: hypothetical protein H7282_10225 [Cytophagaceae bacterium]|nr:hypothetical protein [Cytophagaceae bacterium]